MYTFSNDSYVAIFSLSPRHILVLVLTPQKTAKASVEAPPDIFSATNGPIPFGFCPKPGVAWEKVHNTCKPHQRKTK